MKALNHIYIIQHNRLLWPHDTWNFDISCVNHMKSTACGFPHSVSFVSFFILSFTRYVIIVHSLYICPPKFAIILSFGVRFDDWTMISMLQMYISTYTYCYWLWLQLLQKYWQTNQQTNITQKNISWTLNDKVVWQRHCQENVYKNCE